MEGQTFGTLLMQVCFAQYQNMHFTILIAEKLKNSIVLFKGVDLTLMVLIQPDHLKIQPCQQAELQGSPSKHIHQCTIPLMDTYLFPCVTCPGSMLFILNGQNHPHLNFLLYITCCTLHKILHTCPYMVIHYKHLQMMYIKFQTL